MITTAKKKQHSPKPVPLKKRDHFVYVLCNLENQDLLKEEVALKYPELKLAFSTPGFVTYKRSGEVLLNKLALARAWGECLGKIGPHEVNKFQGAHAYSLSQDKQWEERMNAKLGPISVNEERGKKICEIYQTTKGELWVGERKLPKNLRPLVGADPQLVLPEHALSRAYLKAQEAHLIWEIPFKAGQGILELGAHPGGMSQYFLEQGLKVIAVDTAPLDQQTLKKLGPIEFVQCKANDLNTKKLKFPLDWLSVDLNLTPPQSFSAIELVLKNAPSIKGALWNMKVKNVQSLQTLDEWRSKLAGLGLASVSVKQLKSNAQEVTLFALRSK